MLRAVAARLGVLTLLAALGAVAAPGAPAEAYQPWGRAASSDKVVQPRCHHYTFRYRVTVPTDDWAAEFFLSGPGGVGMASQAALSNSDPDRGQLSWRLCRNAITYGRHKIRMKVTYRDRFGDNRAGWVQPTYFRMVRPRR